MQPHRATRATRFVNWLVPPAMGALGAACAALGAGTRESPRLAPEHGLPVDATEIFLALQKGEVPEPLLATWQEPRCHVFHYCATGRYGYGEHSERKFSAGDGCPGVVWAHRTRDAGQGRHWTFTLSDTLGSGSLVDWPCVATDSPGECVSSRVELLSENPALGISPWQTGEKPFGDDWFNEEARAYGLTFGEGVFADPGRMVLASPSCGQFMDQARSEALKALAVKRDVAHAALVSRYQGSRCALGGVPNAEDWREFAEHELDSWGEERWPQSHDWPRRRYGEIIALPWSESEYATCHDLHIEAEAQRRAEQERLEAQRRVAEEQRQLAQEQQAKEDAARERAAAAAAAAAEARAAAEKLQDMAACQESCASQGKPAATCTRICK